MAVTTQDRQPGMLAGIAEPPVGRNAAIGALIGFVVCVAAVTAGGAASGMDVGAALGLGIFIGMWGGAGFGFMMGATVTLSLHDAHDKDHRTHPEP